MFKLIKKIWIIFIIKKLSFQKITQNFETEMKAIARTIKYFAVPTMTIVHFYRENFYNINQLAI